MYSLLSTKPFFVNRVHDLVLTRSVFDNVFAFFVNLDGFAVDPVTTSTNLTLTSHDGKLFTPAEVTKFIQSAKSTDRFGVDTLYISADMVTHT